MPEVTSAEYAIVDIGGKQFRVTPGQELKVPHIDGEPGSNLEMDHVLLLNDGGKTVFGHPTVKGASVDATLLGHDRDRKIIVFKFRRRKGYRRKAGHRQDYSLLRINRIHLAKEKPPATGQTEEKPAGVKKPAPAKKSAGPKKTTAAKKSTPSKQSATAKKPASVVKSATTKESTSTSKRKAAGKTAKKPTTGQS